MKRWRLLSFLVPLAGLGLAAAAVVYVGPGKILEAIGRVGWGGFAAYALLNLAVFGPLGLAWWSVTPGMSPRRAPLFAWARLVREAASDVLPFSQIAGLWAGVSVVRQWGLNEQEAVASQIADLAAEMAAQLVYTLFGAACLLSLISSAPAARTLVWASATAFMLGIATLGGFVLLQGRGIDLIGRIADRWIEGSRARADAVKATLSGIYRMPLRLAAGFALHGFCWVLGGVASWLALGFMGVHIPVWKVLAMESLLAAVRSVAFMTPGGLGFQEGAYVLMAPVFGVTPVAGLTLSILRRAKDLALGVGALCAWWATRRGGSEPEASPSPLAGEDHSRGAG